MPQLPSEPVREGGRWRYHKPTSEEVAEWFKSVPLDEGMSHEDYVSGVVIIPAQEKVKVQVERNGRPATEDAYELTFTPYTRVDTRITYFRKLAALHNLIAVIEPVQVPRSKGEHTNNENLPDGFWWHVAQRDNSHVKFLCCTMRVALYREEDWFREVKIPPVPESQEHAFTSVTLPVPAVRPIREGVATKQVVQATQQGVDVNMLAKAETGAIGRALGMAGILVVGTGIATADDMAEVRAVEAPAVEPDLAPLESPEEINERLMALSADLQERHPDKWTEFSAWWTERQGREGWSSVNDAPIEVRRGLVRRLETTLAEADAETKPETDEPPPPDSSHDNVSGK